MERIAARDLREPRLLPGFGDQWVVSPATFYAEGEALGAPDAWDPGYGIGGARHLGGLCAAALTLACPVGNRPLDPSGAAGTTADLTGAGGTAVHGPQLVSRSGGCALAYTSSAPGAAAVAALLALARARRRRR